MGRRLPTPPCSPPPEVPPSALGAVTAAARAPTASSVAAAAPMKAELSKVDCLPRSLTTMTTTTAGSSPAPSEQQQSAESDGDSREHPSTESDSPVLRGGAATTQPSARQGTRRRQKHPQATHLQPAPAVPPATALHAEAPSAAPAAAASSTAPAANSFWSLLRARLSGGGATASSTARVAPAATTPAHSAAKKKKALQKTPRRDARAAKKDEDWDALIAAARPATPRWMWALVVFMGIVTGLVLGGWWHAPGADDSRRMLHEALGSGMDVVYVHVVDMDGEVPPAGPWATGSSGPFVAAYNDWSRGPGLTGLTAPDDYW